MRENVYHKSKAVNALNSGAIATNTTTNGVEVDLWQTATRDFDSVLFVARATAYTDGDFALSVEHSDSSGTGYEAAPADMVSGPTASVTAVNAPQEVAYHGNKRYCRMVVTSTGVTSGATLNGVAVLWNSHGSNR